MKQNNQLNNQENEFETVVSFTEEEIEEIKQKAIKKVKEAKHKWRQKGRWLVCKSCEYPHAVYIGNKVMVGEKDGQPILEDRDKAIKKA